MDRLRAYRRRREEDRAWSRLGTADRPAAPVRIRPVPYPPASPPPMGPPRPSRIPIGPRGLLRFAIGATVATALFLAWEAMSVDASTTGIRDGDAITPERLAEITVRVKVSNAGLDGAVLRLDGTDITEKAIIDDEMVAWKPGDLAEGEHRLELTVPRDVLPDATLQWDFVVDGRPPTITVPAYLPPQPPDEPIEFEGNLVGADTLTANGKEVDIDGDGRFTLRYERPPTGPIVLVARDQAGNERRATVFAPVPYPEVVRGVHVTATAWDNARLRQGILDLIDAGAINSVALTIKDEGGLVGHESDVRLAREIGAVQNLYDLEKQVDFLHSKGVHVIGRIVCFRDPKLADAAWERGDREMVIQAPDGDRYGGYGGGFTNFAHPEVQQYNLDLAAEAVRAGVDDILYDYVRRPDGHIETMVIPGLDRSPTDVVVDFLAESHELVRELGGVQGASVFGIAATRPEQIAQDILGMASHTDYIAPMLYPSHWNKGEYGVDDPDRQPYDIIKASLRDFKQQVARTGRPLVPWLQHFSLQSVYGPKEIRDQIRAAEDSGVPSWLMWDPGVTYDAAALAP